MTPPTDPPREEHPDDIVQMNVRVRRGLRDQLDARRAVKDMSRDKWVANALQFALNHHPQAAPLTNSVGRTATPPHRRT